MRVLRKIFLSILGIFVLVNIGLAAPAMSRFMQPVLLPSSDAVLTVHLNNIQKYSYIGLYLNKNFMGTEKVNQGEVTQTVTMGNIKVAEMLMFGYGSIGENSIIFYGCQDAACSQKTAPFYQSANSVDIEKTGPLAYLVTPNTVTVNF